MKGAHSRRVLFAVAFVGVNIFIFSVAYAQWRNYERLAHVGIQTKGRVTAKEPANHQSIRYEYSVASNSFSALNSAGFGGLPPLSQIRIGDEIDVTYWPQNPSVSVPGNPAEFYSSWSVVLFVVGPLFGLLAGSATAWRAGRSRV